MSSVHLTSSQNSSQKSKPSQGVDNSNPEDLESHPLEQKYRAPALEKGLDILELLAGRSSPMTTTHMASVLQRSVSELFRMVLTLEQRGYIAQANDGRDGFGLTNKLFTMGISQYNSVTLLEVALPILRDLVQDIAQSCHLLILSGDEVIVVARQESPMDLGCSARIGHTSLLADSHAGALFYGYSSARVQANWLSEITAQRDSVSVKQFLAKAKLGVEQGYLEAKNDYIDSITDLCVPVLGFQTIMAVLVVPFMRIKSHTTTTEIVLELLHRSAKKISQSLVV